MSATWPQITVECAFSLDPASPLTYPPICGDSATFARSIGNWQNGGNANLLLNPNFAPLPYRNSLLVGAASNGNMTVGVDTDPGTVVPTGQYTITLRVRAGSVGRFGSAVAQWYDAAGVTLINSTSVGFLDGTSSWTTVTITSTVGFGASRLQLLVTWLGCSGGELHSLAAVVTTVSPASGFGWTDISRYVRSLDLTRSSRQYELGRFEAGTATLTVDNTGGRFDPNNTSGPYYPNLAPIVPIRIKAIWQGNTYPLWAGFVERWPQTWQDPALSLPQITCVDSLAALSQGELRTTYEEEVLLDNPVSFYPLDEAASTPQGGDIVAAGATSTFVSSSPFPGFSQFGGPSIIYDGASSVNMNPSGVSSSHGDVLDFSSATGANLVHGQDYTVELFAAQDGSTATTNGPLFCHLTSGGSPTGIEIVIGAGSTNTIRLVVGGTTVYTSPGAYFPGLGLGVYLCVTVSAGGTVTFYYSTYGVSLTQLYTGTPSLGSTVAHTVVGGDWLGSSANNVYQGFVSHVAFYNQVLPLARIQAHAQVGVNGGYASETTGERFARVLNYWGWPFNYRSIMGGLVFAGSVASASNSYGLKGLAGQSALDAAQDQGDAEHGQVYSLADGSPCFEDNQWRPGQSTPQNIFDPTAGLPYQLDSLQIDDDPTYIYNTVSITQDGGPQFRVTNATSAQQYLSRTYTATIKVALTSEAQNRANLLLRQYKDPRSRLAAFQFEPSANPTQLFTPALLMDISDLNRVVVRPLGAPSWTFNGYVDALSHSIMVEPGSQSWKVTCQLSPVLPT